MDMLKKLFPYSFGAEDVKTMLIKILVYVLGGTVAIFVLGLLPIIGNILGWIVNIYTTIGWILVALDYMKVLK